MNDFEKNIASRKFQTPHPEWERKILDAAERALPLTPVKHRTRPALLDWLWPNPFAYGALATLWLIILGLRLTQPADTATRPDIAVNPPTQEEMLHAMRERQQLLSQYNL